MPPRILLADDSVTVQKVIELTFSDEGMQVVAVGDGRQAIERLDVDPPDIVLADVSMPERDGYAVAEYVKGTAALRHIPVVLMTGAFEQLDEARARAVGCDGVLAKPFEPQLVIALVRELLARPSGTPRAGDPAPAPEIQAAPAAADDRRTPTLDDFFDRIDESTAGQRAPAVEADADTLITMAPAAGVQAGGGSVLADAFSAILADELGEAPLPPSWAGFGPAAAAPSAPAGAATPVITEAFVEEVTRRVVERLSASLVRQVVDEKVIDVAERLVLEEIGRLKAGM